MKDFVEGEQEDALGTEVQSGEIDTLANSAPQISVLPYILAGGRSSRMGKDKAMMLLAGRTLLGRAVDTLRAVPGLRNHERRVVITVVGERTELEGADRVIVDRYSGCGPLGGMEAALRDLEESGGGEWALFVPVDMPFLPSGLIDGLLREWSNAGRQGAKACYVQADENAQPLVSMLHKTLRPFLSEALTTGQFKVTRVLQSAADVLASIRIEGIGYVHSSLHKTHLDLKSLNSSLSGWAGNEEQEKLQHLWFSNVNSGEEFLKAEKVLSMRHPS